MLTRPLADSQATAAELNKKNIASVIEPLFEIVPRNIRLNTGIFRALVFTSRHAVTIFADSNAVRDLPVFCVGDQTAETAKEQGFTEIHSADGNEDDLFELITSRIERSTALLRLTGYDHADRLADRLRKNNYTVVTSQIYDTAETEALSDKTIHELRTEKIDGVLFFSPKTVSRFYTLLDKHGLIDTCRNITAWCISDNVGLAAKDLPFREIRTAARPTQNDLIELILNEPKRSNKMFTEEELPPLPKFRVTKWLMSGLMVWSLFFGAIGALAVLLLIDYGPEKVSERILPTKEFDAKVSAVDSRVAALEKRTKEIDAQQQDIARNGAPQDTQLAKILIGLTQLKTAYDNDASLNEGIATLKGIIRDNTILQNLNDLEQRTAANFPSKEKILEDLQNVQNSSGSALKNEQGEQAMDWKSRAKLAFSQLVRVTPTKNIVKDKDIERVEQAVASGNFNLAKKFAAKLPNTPNTQLVVAEITARSEAENIVRKIISQIGSAIGRNAGRDLY